MYDLNIFQKKKYNLNGIIVIFLNCNHAYTQGYTLIIYLKTKLRKHSIKLYIRIQFCATCPILILLQVIKAKEFNINEP